MRAPWGRGAFSTLQKPPLSLNTICHSSVPLADSPVTTAGPAGLLGVTYMYVGMILPHEGTERPLQ